MRRPHWWLGPLASASALTMLLLTSTALILLMMGHPPSSGQWTVIGLSMLTVILTALGYGRLRQSVMRLLSRLAPDPRHVPEELSRTFVTGLSRAVPLDETLLGLVEALRVTFGLSIAEVWTADESTLLLAVSDPPAPGRTVSLDPELRAALARAEVRGEAWARIRMPALLAAGTTGPVLVVPIVHAGVVLGILTLGRPAGAPPYAGSDIAPLTELCRHMALALYNLRLDSALQASHEALHRSAVELRDSRARVVAAADAERLKIERDLHDGAQQRLLAVWMRLGEARSGPSTEQQAQLLSAIAGLQDAMAELRELAQGIYPPLLTEYGLAEALTAACRNAALPTRTDITVDGRYAPAVEASVYFACLESLANAAKHAGAGAQAVLALHETGGCLEFTVRDNGIGFAIDSTSRTRPTEGIGLTSIRDRIGAIGGTVDIHSAAGQGTSVIGRIPLIGAGVSPPSLTGTGAPP